MGKSRQNVEVEEESLRTAELYWQPTLRRRAVVVIYIGNYVLYFGMYIELESVTKSKLLQVRKINIEYIRCMLIC